MMCVGRRKASGIKVQDVTHLCDGLRPGRRGNSEKLALNSRLMLAQQFCVDFYVVNGATDIGGFLRRYATMFVELDRDVIHGAHSRQFAARRTGLQN